VRVKEVEVWVKKITERQKDSQHLLRRALIMMRSEGSGHERDFTTPVPKLGLFVLFSMSLRLTQPVGSG